MKTIKRNHHLENRSDWVGYMVGIRDVPDGRRVILRLNFRNYIGTRPVFFYNREFEFVSWNVGQNEPFVAMKICNKICRREINAIRHFCINESETQ